MIQKRRALLAALLAGGSAVPAGAGCFDWLFHKHKQPTPVLPYAVGFAPTTTVTPLGPPIAVGAPTVMQGPAATPQMPIGQVSDMTPMTAPALGPGGYMSSFGGYRAATAAQMPAYGAIPGAINNPSVITGMPVNIGTPANAMSAFRASGDTTAYYGGAVLPQASYNAAAAYQSQMPMGQPQHFQPQPVATGGGLLGHVLGNQYQTNYNNVPTTVYRPVQQVDPTTGQVVIVQQPCTTTTQQVQRTPYTSLQPAQPAQPPVAAPHYGEPTCGNEYLSPGQAAPSQYAPGQTQPQAMVQPGGYAPIGSGLSQATAVGPSTGSAPGYASPIPSTAAPSTAPLQGYPSGAHSAGDAATVQQPRLESSRPSLAPPVTSSYPEPDPPSQNPWRSDNGATYRTPEPTQEPTASHGQSATGVTPPRTTSAGAGAKYSDLPPIPAADDYRPPAWQPYPGGEAKPAEPDRWRSQPRPLSPPSLEDRTVSRPQQGSFDRGEQSTRYASSQREPQRQVIKPIANAPRDDSGWFAIEP